ncbi:peptidase U34 [Synergistales bacterium]|nr:peptidase U34 [Synergistales bacterium]
MISLIVLSLLILLAGFAGVKAAEGCFAVAAGKDASATGRVMIAHNEDNCGELVMRHHYIQAQAADDLLGDFSFEEGSAPLKRPARTYGFFWTETLRAEPGEAFGDSFVNERGVAVVSNNCRESRAPAGEDQPLSEGGIGWGLRFMVAACSESAREAVAIAGRLVKKYGYRASGRSYIFADPNEAWVFQVIRGKAYAAKRLPDDEVTVCPNHYTIRNIPLQGDKTNILSPKLPYIYAAEQGWAEYSRVRELDFARVFQHPDYVMTEMNKYRHQYGLAAFTGQSFQDKDDLPFSVVPKEKVTIEKLREVLSCHCGVSAEEAHRTGDCMEMSDETRNRFASVCNGAARESLIVDLRRKRGDSVIWSCFGNPCALPMTPWRLGAELMPKQFSGYDEGDEKSLGELIRLHFRATADDLKASAPEAWAASREFVRRFDEANAAAKSALSSKMKSIENHMYVEELIFDSARGDPFIKAQCPRMAGVWARFTSESLRKVLQSIEKQTDKGDGIFA